MPVVFAGGASPQMKADTFTNNSHSRFTAKEVIAAKRAASLSRRAAREHMEAAVANIKKIHLAFNRKLQYEVDQQSHEVTVKVIDGNTNKVIKVLPPEELKRLRRGVNDAAGALFDEEV
ncbi:MAG: flagellar protein FlaG [Spirochaetaceae bacterium]|nr:flagellar protein FlaG [Spirochaetaceae bacterium]